MEEDYSHLYASDSLEPLPKKRCIRFCSELSTEDPSLISDSGFSDLSTEPKSVSQHGDSEASSFFGLDLSDLPDPEGHNEIGEENEKKGKHVYHPDGTLLLADSSILNNTIDPSSDPSCYSRSSSSASDLVLLGRENSNSNSSSTSSSSHNASTSSTSSDDSSSWEDILLKSKDVAGSPAKSLMMQRFLSHLRNNPNDSQLQHFFQLLLSGPEFSPPRHRLRHVTHITDAIRLLRCSKKILVLTGAGISVSCGIPDFRSKDGLYARVSKVFPSLPDPQSVFDIRLFRRDPRPFFLTAKELYPGQFEPSLSHKFIRKLESRGHLLRNYSQNIDTLETIAGIQKVTMCHGSFATASCIRCKHKVDADAIKAQVLLGEVPFCTVCSSPEEISKIKFPIQSSPQSPAHIGPHRRPAYDVDDDDDEIFPPLPASLPVPPVLKPDIVFFGEDLPDEFHSNLEKDKPDCDLLLVIGSSLRVRPVSLIPGMLPPEVPQILINRESLSHCRFDIELLGNCDEIISHLCRSLGPDFADLASNVELQEIEKLPKPCTAENQKIGEPQSENDIQALKACWEPKVNEDISDKLPDKTYLGWHPRQYVFKGAEIMLDSDEDDDDEEDDDSDSESESDSSVSSTETPEIRTEQKIPNLNEKLPVTANPSSQTQQPAVENHQPPKIQDSQSM